MLRGSLEYREDYLVSSEGLTSKEIMMELKDLVKRHSCNNVQPTKSCEIITHTY